MENKIIKALLSHELFLKYSPKLYREYFSDDLAVLYDILVEYHGDNNDDLDLSDLAELYQARTALSTSQSRIFDNLIRSIDSSGEVNEKVMLDVLEASYKKHIAKEVIHAAVPIMNSGEGSFDEVQRLIDEVDHGPSQSFESTSTEIGTVLSTTSATRQIRFRPNQLAEKIGQAGGGNTAAIFGRPEVGKTSFTCFQVAGFLEQGFKVVYCANEEPASQVVLRLASAILARTERELQNMDGETTAQWDDIRQRLKVYDATGWGLQEVDAVCVQEVPQVLILDQTDKFNPLSSKYAPLNNIQDWQKIGLIWRDVRSIAKKRSIFAINVTQASAEADNRRYPGLAHLARSRTDKGAEVDLAMGLGMSVPEGQPDNNLRYINVCKNKLSGWHGYITTIFNPGICQFIE